MQNASSPQRSISGHVGFFECDSAMDDDPTVAQPHQRHFANEDATGQVYIAVNRPKIFFHLGDWTVRLNYP